MIHRGSRSDYHRRRAPLERTRLHLEREADRAVTRDEVLVAIAIVAVVVIAALLIAGGKS